jgi:hypothetical protein
MFGTFAFAKTSAFAKAPASVKDFADKTADKWSPAIKH